VKRILGCVIAIGATGFLALLSQERARAEQTQDASLSAFMRQKLDNSSLILEGLTVENEKLISEGADALLKMSNVEKWNVLADNDYREFNRDFRNAVRKLDEAAKAKNFDNATLQWFDAVKACVECHKYVRSQRPTIKK
jgi:hypothetical protein